MFDNLSYRGYNAKYEKAQKRPCEVHKGPSKIKIQKTMSVTFVNRKRTRLPPLYSLAPLRKWLKEKSKERQHTIRTSNCNMERRIYRR